MPTSVAAPAHGSGSRTAWRTVGAGLAVVVLLVAGLVSWTGFGPVHTGTQSDTYREPVSRVVLDTSEGDVIVSAGEAGAVTVEQRTFWTSLTGPTVSQSVAGETLTVEGRCPGAFRVFGLGGDCAVDYLVQVPPEVAVEVRTQAGTVRVSDLTGEVRVSAATGEVQLGNLAGPLWVEVDSGDVVATGLRSGPVEVRASAGDLDLTFAGPATEVRASTGAGDVTVALAAGRYQVSAEADAGRETVAVTVDPDAPSTITVRTGAGDVAVRYAG